MGQSEAELQLYQTLYITNVVCQVIASAFKVHQKSRRTYQYCLIDFTHRYGQR